MYFAYGWPRVPFSELPAGDDAYVFVHVTEKYVFAVSRTTVQLWSGGLHRVRLSECVRSDQDLEQEGYNVTAIWSSAKATLAILVSGGMTMAVKQACPVQRFWDEPPSLLRVLPDVA